MSDKDEPHSMNVGSACPRCGTPLSDLDDEFHKSGGLMVGPRLVVCMKVLDAEAKIFCGFTAFKVDGEVAE